MQIYVTHCDKYYLSRVVALEASLRKNGDRNLLVVVAHDLITKSKIESLNLPLIQVHLLSEVVELFPVLKEARSNRSRLEFIFCVTPFIIDFVRFSTDCTLAIYLDADLFFFQSPSIALEDFSDIYDVSIIEHNFTPEYLHLTSYGRFNVGWLAFRANQNGVTVLNWWKHACLESTSVKTGTKIYADQKYLDQFPCLFDKIHVNRRSGLNIAPWNIREVHLSENIVTVENSKLVFFHFSGYRKYKRLRVLGLSGYSHRADKCTRENIFKVYSEAIDKAEDLLNLKDTVEARKYSLREVFKIIIFRDFIFH